MREPRRLVRPLLAYQDQHDVVDHLPIRPRRHHRHQPLPQVLVEQDLLVRVAPHVDRQRQAHDGVALLRRPRRQVLQVVAERMVLRHVVRLDDVLQMLLDDGLLAAQLTPQRVDVAVRQVLVAVGHPAVAAEDGQQALLVLPDDRALRQPVHLRAVAHLVVAQQHAPTDHLLYLRRRGILRLPRLLVLLR